MSSATVDAFLRRARIEGLLHEAPVAGPPTVRRLDDELALLFGVLEGGADEAELAVVEEDDFTSPLTRVVFRYLRDAGDVVPDIDAMIERLADRHDTTPEVVRRTLEPLIGRPSAWHSSVADKARALHEIGRLRRLFDAIACLEAEARVMAARDIDFDAEHYLRRTVLAVLDAAQLSPSVLRELLAKACPEGGPW